MIRTSGFPGPLRSGVATVVGVLCVLLLPGPARGADSNCPTDRFSARIDALLQAVEGPDFPSADNLATWQSRREDIHRQFSEVLVLAADDAARRRAAVQALVVAQSLSASPGEARTLGSGPETGEARAWARHVLKGYYTMGAAQGDVRYLNRAFISELKKTWADKELAHPQRDLALYQEKAGALRELARFEQPPAAGCATKP